MLVVLCQVRIVVLIKGVSILRNLVPIIKANVNYQYEVFTY